MSSCRCSDPSCAYSLLYKLLKTLSVALSDSSFSTPINSETRIVVVIVGRVEVAIRHPSAPRTAEPAPTTIHPERVARNFYGILHFHAPKHSKTAMGTLGVIRSEAIRHLSTRRNYEPTSASKHRII